MVADRWSRPAAMLQPLSDWPAPRGVQQQRRSRAGVSGVSVKQCEVVPRPGLEPGWVSPYAPQTYAYTNSATWASRVVPREGLEPTRPCGHMVLNHARLPIPPPRHARTRTEVRVRRSMIPRRPSGLRQEVEQAEGDEEDGEDDREAE